jgi:hypothetical protein
MFLTLVRYDNTYSAEMTTIQFVFAHFSFYILFPLLYIIISTGDIRPIMVVWNFIQSGIFNTFGKIKEVLTNILYSTLWLFGEYSFSTYTIVRNGREIYTTSSISYNRTSDIYSVYRIDRAKYNVCKWIDRQCKQYKLENNGERPELTETHNDIYDFILHKVDDSPYTRIHRGDFSGKTHTLFTEHYREYEKSYQIGDTAVLTVRMPIPGTDDGTILETFTINLKTPHQFLIEKNEFLDKKFLQWKLYNEFGRKDVADYIGLPFSTYKVTLSYSDYMDKYNPTVKEAKNPLYVLDDGHSIIVGNKYIVKVDAVLRCPVFESTEHQVYDTDGILSSYYNCSDTDADSDADAESESESDAESDSDVNAEEDVDAAEDDAVDPEFEVIEGEGEGDGSE